jgi:hypothetical protein
LPAIMPVVGSALNGTATSANAATASANIPTLENVIDPSCPKNPILGSEVYDPIPGLESQLRLGWEATDRSRTGRPSLTAHRRFCQNL